MTVTCKMVECPFHTQDDFCEKSIVTIDEMGMCKLIWWNGQQRRLKIPVEEIYTREKMNIMEGIANEQETETINDEKTSEVS